MCVMNIWWIILFVLLEFSKIFAVNADYYNSCPTSNSETTYVKLKDSVLCLYDNSVRPVANHQNKTTVSFRLFVKYFNYDVVSSTVSFDLWLSVSWMDEHLTWKPTDHENIDNIHLHTSDIWTPDLSLFNKANQGEDPTIISDIKCRVRHDGLVLCVPPIHLDSLCVPNLERFPFDVHNCTMRFGLWSHRGDEVDINMVQRIIDTRDMYPNGEWALKNLHAIRNAGIYKCCPNDTFPSININFTIERLSGAHAATIIIPCIVVIMLTFAMLSLSPMDRERLIMGYVNIIAQFLQVQYLSYLVPLKGDTIPMIVLFGRDSLLLSIFAIIFTLIFKKMMDKKTTPPSWISSIVSLVISCKPGQIILLSDYSVKGVATAKGEEDGTTIVNSESNNSSTQDWVILAKILDKLFFLCYIIVYFIMIVSFWP